MCHAIHSRYLARTGDAFYITGPLASDRWIPLTKGQYCIMLILSLILTSNILFNKQWSCDSNHNVADVISIWCVPRAQEIHQCKRNLRGVFCEFKVWLKFNFCGGCALCNIVIIWPLTKVLIDPFLSEFPLILPRYWLRNINRWHNASGPNVYMFNAMYNLSSAG